MTTEEERKITGEKEGKESAALPVGSHCVYV